LKKEANLIQTISNEAVFTAHLYDNGIIDIRWNEKLLFIDIEHLLEVKKAVEQLGGGKRMRLFFFTHDFIQTTPQAQELAATEKYTEFTLAVAVLVNSMALRLAMNFFMRLHRPFVPSKGFDSREKAHEWLLSVPD